MKNILFVIYLLFVFVSTSLAVEFNIKQDNKIQTLNATQSESGFMVDGFVFDNNAFLQVEFNEITPQKVKDFESKYNLKLQMVMVIGAYIYKHDSDILLLIDEISQEKNIKTIKPVWSNTQAVLY